MPNSTMLLDRQVRPLHRLTRAVLPQMLAPRKGKIVVVGSATGLRGQPRCAAYSAARAAQHGYVRSVGAEVAAFDVNVVATGQTFVENPTYFPPSYQATEEFKQRMQGATGTTPLSFSSYEEARRWIRLIRAEKSAMSAVR